MQLVSVSFRPSLKKSPSSLLVIALCVTNLVFLWTQGTNDWVQHGLDIKLVDFTYVCLVWPYISLYIVGYMEYIIALVTVFRCLAVAKPHKVVILCSKKRAKIAMGFGALVWALLILPMPFGKRFAPGPIPENCKHSIPFLIGYEYWMQAMWSGLACAITFLGNGIIIYRMCRNTAATQQMSSSQAAAVKDARNRRVTYVLLAISSMYIITIAFSVTIFLIDSLNMFIRDPYSYDRVIIAKEVFVFYQYCVISFGHFICYTVSGSDFRTECMKVITCKCS